MVYTEFDGTDTNQLVKKERLSIKNSKKRVYFIKKRPFNAGFGEKWAQRKSDIMEHNMYYVDISIFDFSCLISLSL